MGPESFDYHFLLFFFFLLAVCPSVAFIDSYRFLTSSTILDSILVIAIVLGCSPLLSKFPVHLQGFRDGCTVSLINL